MSALRGCARVCCQSPVLLAPDDQDSNYRPMSSFLIASIFAHRTFAISRELAVSVQNRMRPRHGGATNPDSSPPTPSSTVRRRQNRPRQQQRRVATPGAAADRQPANGALNCGNGGDRGGGGGAHGGGGGGGRVRDGQGSSSEFGGGRPCNDRGCGGGGGAAGGGAGGGAALAAARYTARWATERAPVYKMAAVGTSTPRTRLATPEPDTQPRTPTTPVDAARR